MKTQKILKNTLFLYFRMLLIMAVSLYTVRVVLHILGVTDYGIYNVISGMISILSFLRVAMASATQRFLSYNLGKNDMGQVKNSFQISVTIYFLISFIMVLLLETIGLWVFRTKIVLPSERLYAANWVYQFMVFSSFVITIATPYNAAIIAHEQMKFFTYISIIEQGLILTIVFILPLFSQDKLIIFSILSFIVTLITGFVYFFFCRARYDECRLSFNWDILQFKIMTSYLGWNLLGNIANVLKIHGVNILLNMFFGPSINAARAIAYQVSTALGSFTQNFTTAARPQIIKSYAKGEYDYMFNLVLKSSKFMYFLMLILSMPVLLETSYILNLWLNDVPERTVLFTRLVVIDALITSFSYLLVAVNHATGKIRNYQCVVGGFLILNLPISWVSLKMGAPPQITMVISIIISFFGIFARLLILRREMQFPVKRFLIYVLFISALVTIVSLILPLVLTLYLDMGLKRFLLVLIAGIVSCIVTICFVGINKEEKKTIVAIVNQKMKERSFLKEV